MAKITVKAVTRLQKFLAAIAGDGVAPNPITDKEKLLHNIAENVNNGGGSGGGGVLVVHDENGTLDKTWQDIFNAFCSTGAVVALSESHFVGISEVGYDTKSQVYTVELAGDSYTTETASGYPSNSGDPVM